MEYCSRILYKVGTLPSFQFHSRCKHMKLNHLIFADDLLLFSKGDYNSICMLMSALKMFAETSGLQMSLGKSEMYLTGMTEDEISRIQQVTGFRIGSLPFRYLGAPMSTKRLKVVNDCEALIDKMCMRVKVVLHNINSICRNYLWHGSYDSNSPGYVAWDMVCTSKDHGVLGVRNILLWNQAAVAKHVWAISHKKDSLWVKWVHSVYINEANWEGYQPPTNASWVWKCICHIKDQLWPMIAINDATQFSIAKTYKAPLPNGLPWRYNKGYGIDFLFLSIDSFFGLL
ncbi:uncharacterized protein LOC125492891 [Beta vulgaris subsp. vulgaris]|uniref:uncharacterized protein LOC125492891 n=1 Tax=Beta vulgaris subsp. vulgaris TaxID=3555 RepID=UPI002036CA47|nr:uncharacterized protein LOC125492891 [Beta vulgaris subsp. vulgaris]